MENSLVPLYVPVVKHPWKNGGDNSRPPQVSLGVVVIKILSDMDCDADGSPRATVIDPGCGNVATSLSKDSGWNGSSVFVNSETIPYIVLPLNFGKEAMAGIVPALGCLCHVRYGKYSCFALYADEGPETLIGEGSIALMEALGGNPWNEEHTKIVCGLPAGVEYTVFPSLRDLSVCVSFDSIQAWGRAQTGLAINYVNKQTPPTPPTPPIPPVGEKYWKKKGVCIDIGHGKQPDGSFDTGAFDTDTSTTERSLNEIHAAACAKRLKELGCPVDVQPAGLSLEARGKGAAGYDVFISDHHNWYYSKAQHTLAFLGANSTASDQALGEMITKAVSAALDDKTTAKVEVPNEGTREEGYTVPNKARSTDVRACCLTEAYFIDHPGAHGHHQEWSRLAGVATAEAIVAWLKANR